MFFVGFLVLVLLLPIEWIRGLVVEREGRHAAVRQELATTWGGKQMLSGPVVIVPYLEEAMQKVLIVDDDAHIREVIAFTLEQAGFRPVEAADGAEALERFERERPDLVILDIVMPELDGTEVCRRLRRRSPVPIVFLSSRDDEVDRILGLELGGDDYLTKPFSPRELLARVRAVLRRSHGESAETPEEGRRLLRHGRLTLDLDQFKAFWEARARPARSDLSPAVGARRRVRDPAAGRMIVSSRAVHSTGFSRSSA